MIDSLEPRTFLSVTPEFRWMIQMAGGAIAPGPTLTFGTNLSTSGGYAKTTSPSTVIFSGAADPAATAGVKVNGVAANYTPATGAWTLTNTANAANLKPGINAVQIRSYDADSNEVTHKEIDVWYDDGSVQNVSGTLSGNINWTAAAGPYLVTANVTIPSGSTLTIEPGASVYFASGTRLTVNGRISANGTDFSHIRFTRDPSGSASWTGIFISGTTQNNTMSYGDVAFAGSGGADTTIASSKADLDHMTWASPGANQRIIDITGTSTFSVTNSVIPPLSGQEPTHFLGTVGAYALLQHNAYGTTTGHNDIIDFTGGNRPGTIFQILDNWFTGTGPNGSIADDILDVDGTDAHIEGNVFMNVPGSGISDTNSAISGGGDSGNTSEVVSTRNFFYNVDHGFLMKEGNSITSINDTFVHVHTGVFNFDEPGFAAGKGKGGIADGDVFVDVPMNAGVPVLLQNAPTGAFTVINSIAPGASPYPGAGNIAGDAMLVKTAAVNDPRDDFQLKPGSPAIGTGPNGTDMGAAVPFGVSLNGEPVGYTNQKNATLTVGTGFGTTGTTAAGYTAYKYRINNGAYSAETPIGTPINLTNLPDGTYTLYAIGKNDANVYQTDAQATVSKTWTVDNVAPKVTSANFNYQIAAQSLTLQFSEDVGAIDPSAITLKNDTTNTVINTADINVSYDAATHLATITFPSLPNSRLPDGNYQITLASSAVKDLATNTLDGDGNGTGGDDYTLNFFQLAGDANHDGKIDFGDLVVVAQNYGGAGKTYAQGDFDFDGTVGFTDLVVIAQKYGTTLPQAAPSLPAASQPVIADAASAPLRSDNTPVFKATPPKPAPVSKPTRTAFATNRIH